jgi:hypothetical protein
MFPANAAGFALIILRSCVALQLVLAIPEMSSALSSTMTMVLAILIALALLIGACTPAVAVLCVFLQLSTLQAHRGTEGLSLVVPLALPFALLLLGPGAYSIDAKRYGRRVVTASNIQ